MAEDWQQWRVTEGLCETQGAEGKPVYGVAVTRPDGDCWQREDVSTCREEAKRLADRLQQEQPASCHWAELVEDFIQALSYI